MGVGWGVRGPFALPMPMQIEDARRHRPNLEVYRCGRLSASGNKAYGKSEQDASGGSASSPTIRVQREQHRRLRSVARCAGEGGVDAALPLIRVSLCVRSVCRTIRLRRACRWQGGVGAVSSNAVATLSLTVIWTAILAALCYAPRPSPGAQAYRRVAQL